MGVKKWIYVFLRMATGAGFGVGKRCSTKTAEMENMSYSTLIASKSAKGETRRGLDKSNYVPLDYFNR